MAIPKLILLLNREDFSTKPVYLEQNGLDEAQERRAVYLILRYMNQKYSSDFAVNATKQPTEVQYYIYRTGKLQFRYEPRRGKKPESFTRTRIFDDDHVTMNEIDIMELETYPLWKI